MHRFSGIVRETARALDVRMVLSIILATVAVVIGAIRFGSSEAPRATEAELSMTRGFVTGGAASSIWSAEPTAALRSEAANRKR